MQHDAATSFSKVGQRQRPVVSSSKRQGSNTISVAKDLEHAQRLWQAKDNFWEPLSGSFADPGSSLGSVERVKWLQKTRNAANRLRPRSNDVHDVYMDSKKSASQEDSQLAPKPERSGPERKEKFLPRAKQTRTQ